jgi:hypothetical protein
MSEYLAEVYHPRSTASAPQPSPEEVRNAVETLSRQGREVCLVRVILVPDDETCFYLFKAESADDVKEAAARAGLNVERLVAAVSAPVSA